MDNKTYLHKYYMKHKDLISERTRAYYKAHREQQLANSKRWHETHPEERREIRRRWNTAHYPLTECSVITAIRVLEQISKKDPIRGLTQVLDVIKLHKEQYYERNTSEKNQEQKPGKKQRNNDFLGVGKALQNFGKACQRIILPGKSKGRQY